LQGSRTGIAINF